ncbi:PREDICTED: CREB-regulated transcription coactivator 1 isoform X8 [Dinoponera quadriceps]|uniref:CREB-regulated transcription coactivator 1 isoform X8 n=1 Tax=Dinoponera quadriceps TaxID=609295 RepID=A0A6P3XF50_DINQU|nr:PREDICTED: CREB-regulated transcription coactivator 1 isoform X8 [Dinoponera quadriceps]
MANPRKFSEKIALLNQKQAQETAAFEAIMREVSDVTSRVASASSSVGASPTGSGVPETPLSVKSAGASPPQSSGKHLHINLGNQFRAGGSLPNVNNNANCGGDAKEHSSPHTGAIHSIDLKTALSNLEEMQNNSMVYRSDNRSRSSMGVGPMRSRPMEKRHDTSPYSGVPYLSPPPPDTWRRTNSDSALHQSANEACQSASAISHRRGSNAYQHAMTGSGSDNRDSHHTFIERPRSSCEMPRVPGINIYPSSQPPGQQIPIGNNTGSLPDLSNVHFPSPIHTPLDQEDHSSSTPFSNGVALENSTSTSQQDLQSYPQQPAPTATSHSPTGHYIYQQPHSPVPPQSPKTSQSQQQQQQQHQQHQQSSQQLNSLGSYRSTQSVNRPSPQSSPSLTVQGSPLSYSNNPSAPPSPTGHPGPPNLTSDAIDQNTYFINQAQAAALQQDFEQFTMGLEWPKFAQQLMELGCTWTTQIEMDTPVQANTIGTYIGSPNHTANFTQNDVINVGGELGSADTGYFSTSPQMAYQPATTTTTATQQLTPQTPNTPTIILTDFSGADDLTNPEFVKDLGTAMMGDFDPEMFPSDDALRQGLDPIDVDGLQMLADPTMVISDSSAEAHFSYSQNLTKCHLWLPF